MPTFIDEIAPEWLDLAATVCGFDAPDRTLGYRWCELGCGQGVTPVVLAATRTNGHFTGIDIMPDHIAAAEELAAAAAVDNVAFRALDFAAAAEFDEPPFDYIVAHGVYSWVDEAALGALHRFVQRKLARGGLFYVSYNAMPGWASDAPFQYLVRSLAAVRGGASDQRFEEATAEIRDLTLAGASTLGASSVVKRLLAGDDKRPLSYFAHEYLAPAWRPRYVTEVRAALKASGLAPIGSATFVENFDQLILRKEAREALAKIPDPNLRELARDYFIDQRFRRDVFGSQLAALTVEQRQQRLLDTHFALLRPPGMVEYSMRSDVGKVSFDNPVSRALVAALDGSSRPLGQCLDDRTQADDLIANVLLLCCASMVTPCPATVGDVSALNDALLRRADPTSALQVTSSATALRFSRELINGEAVSDSARAWRRLLSISRSHRFGAVLSARDAEGSEH